MIRYLKITFAIFYFALRVSWLLLRLGGRYAIRPFRRLYEVELRDAMTGKKLHLTKKQYKRLTYSLGTKDKKQAAKAWRELQERKEKAQDCHGNVG